MAAGVGPLEDLWRFDAEVDRVADPFTFVGATDQATSRRRGDDEAGVKDMASATAGGDSLAVSRGTVSVKMGVVARNVSSAVTGCPSPEAPTEGGSVACSTRSPYSFSLLPK
jgi:hypothetical protein